ncbi:MAG TPA: signal peptide peptidase SppA [Flavipsychrobacter sp.]|nr:signal peptide peptidase SppA [Flavipsychrobacter sp.]
MKQFFKMFFASLLAMIVTGVIIVLFIIGSIAALISKSTSEKTNKVAAGSVLVIDLQKRVHEQGESNALAVLSDEPSYSAGLYDIIQAIKHAKTDDNIKGIFIKLSPVNNGWGTIQQVRMALEDFKTSKKFIYAFGENVTQGAYYVASVADSIYLNPVGAIEIKGFASELAFFKGTLEKLEVQPEIYYAGKFKSATEPFRADKISEPNREQITAFQHDFWQQFLLAAAEHTHKDTAAIDQLALTGAIQFPSDALNNKIVDGLLYWDQVEQRMHARTGQSDTADIKYVSLDQYAENVKLDRKYSDQKIAVLMAEGEISDGDQTDPYQIASKTFIEQIRKLRKNDKIKAVVLRVNSPGGSALASEVILRELQLLRKKKPLIVSMGDLAASGGYYISCQADSIFALPNTITGSIGVFSMLVNIESLMKNKLGVTFDEVKNAPYADFPTVSRPLTADEAKRMQSSVDTIYEIFKSRVSVGRRLSLADVDSIAQGRVWSGSRALKIGLIDGIGNLDRAIASAAKMANLSNYEVATYPEPVDALQTLIRKFKGNSADASISESIKKELGIDYQWYEQIKQWRDNNGKAMMLMPFKINVN